MKFDTGIAPIGNVESGSHFCHFYKSAEDLEETLVPYFKTGLESNESCIWVTATPFPKERAIAALNSHVGGLEERMHNGQLSVYSHVEWYERHAGASRRDIARAWIDAKENALNSGYSGLRLTGNTAFLCHSDWHDFLEYESTLRDAFNHQELVALCSYDSNQCDADIVLDVVAAHDFALARRRGHWEVVENAAIKRSKEALIALNVDLERLVEERTNTLQMALQHQTLLTAEVSHRVKNTVASLQTIVNQTLRYHRSPEEARRVVRGRIAALSRAHDQLAANEWNGVSLNAAVSVVAAPYSRRIERELTDIWLTPRATLALSMLFHELTTNAAQYGALSGEAGRIYVTVDPREQPSDPFRLRWREEAGPRVIPPARAGFGMMLMEQLVTHDLCGAFELDFAPEGVVCTVQAPACEVLAHARGCGHHHAA